MMDKTPKDKDTMWVVTSDSMSGMRGGGPKPLKVEELAVNINLFVEQVGMLLEKTPEKLGNFHFDEFEVHADITAQGTIAVLGSGLNGKPRLRRA